MSSLADAGGGNYTYLESANGLSQVFRDEFDTARETVATGLAVTIRPAAPRPKPFLAHAISARVYMLPSRLHAP